ncbi:transposase [Pelomicrobium methylotrophicum]|uniref:transposase n=1 Tax=Pelomicrobium methylotrophicum TaxID=2602750 RepID=UPI003CC9ECC5
MSRAAAKLDEGLKAWRERPLGEVPYLFLDARYEKVRLEGRIVDGAVLIAVGIEASGKRRVLGCDIAASEAEVNWRRFLENLLARGLKGVKLIIADDHAGLKAARRAVLPAVPWQRCQFHLQQNAGQFVTRKASEEDYCQPTARPLQCAGQSGGRTALEERTRCLAQGASEAGRMGRECRTRIPHGVRLPGLSSGAAAYHQWSGAHQPGLRRRTRVASIFPNPESCLRLVSALLAELDDEWLTGKVYLTLNP